MKKFFIVISGPTAVGKTALVDNIIQTCPDKFEVVNADLGQFYTPLNIGTAKPDLAKQTIKHYLFNILDKPENLTVLEYRLKLLEVFSQIWSQNKIPIVVGGSLFYVKSIFYPPQVQANLNFQESVQDLSKFSTSELYSQLKEIDIERAREINPNDRYRIERALEIWFKHKTKPSELKPKLDLPSDYLFLFLNRERQELYLRINQRVIQMLNEGWIEEVQNLDNNWHDFLKEKKIIGYPEIIKYLDKEIDRETLVALISQKTRAYAKRQLTFFRSLDKLLSNVKEIDLDRVNIDNLVAELCNVG